jgi:hypothetical protein
MASRHSQPKRSSSSANLRVSSCRIGWCVGRHLLGEAHVAQALRVKAHESLPYIVGTNPFIARIYELYSRSFRQLAAFPPVRSIEDNARLADQLAEIVREHTDNIPVLAQGAHSAVHLLR